MGEEFEHEVIDRIGDLVREEHELRARHPDGLDEVDRARLASLEVRLDQCWDLLRQRRARREFGQDASTAHVRDADVVERYQQ